MEDSSGLSKIEIGKETLKNLNTARKWSMFISIIGFIFFGLIVLMGLLAGTFMSVFSTANEGLIFPSWIYFLIFIVFVIIYLFPVLFLFRFSKYSGEAVVHHDNIKLSRAIRNLKAYFVSTGILIIIIMIFYLGILAFMGASMALFKVFR
jgi:hypothetical protein